MLRHSQPSFYNDSAVVYVCPVCSLLMAQCVHIYCTTAECGLEVEQIIIPCLVQLGEKLCELIAKIFSVSRHFSVERRVLQC